MVAQATLLLFGSFFVMLLAGVPISAGIGIASTVSCRRTCLTSDMAT